MAIFEIEANGQTYEIDAPDEATALKAFQSFSAAPDSPANSGAASAAADAPPADAGGVKIGPGNPEGMLQALERSGYKREDFVGAPSQAKDPITAVGDAATAFQSGANQGMTVGWGDEIASGMMAPILAIEPALKGDGYDLGRAYDEAIDFTRGQIKEDQAKNPTAAGLGEVTGSLVTGGTLAKGGVTLLNGAKATVPSIAARSGVEGAIYGGVGGAGRAEGDIEDRLKGGTEGALWGGLLGSAGGAVIGSAASRNANKAVPTLEELEKAADDLYSAAEATGVTWGRNEVRTVADDIAAKVIDAGIDPTLHPMANAALQRLQQAANTGMTVKNVQTMRRILKGAGKDPMNKDQTRIANIMVDEFDKMVAAKTPELALARNIYHQAKNGEMIEKTIELAIQRAGGQATGPGYADALRIEFKALERAIIKGKVTGLTEAEKSAIRHVAQGGSVEKVMRLLSRLAPSGVVSAGVSTGLPFAIGTALTGNPAIGAAASGASMATGYAARGAAAKMAADNAARASAIARNGGLPIDQLAPDDLAKLQALIPALGIEAQRGQMPLEILVTGGNRMLTGK